MAYKAPVDEKQLIADLQNPSTAAQAFDTLMRAYGEQVYWQIRKMVVSHDDANDLLQNCFIKTWKNIHNFRGDARLSTWLYKIAVNESINFLNKERQRQGVTEDGDDSFLLQNIESDENFDGDEKPRIVFNMRYFDEMKYEDMSEALGTSVGALKASYHHAVKKITAAIQNSRLLS